MPTIKLKDIISFTSEDKVHKAENLLSNNTTTKWRCANPGEKQASVVIQLDKATSINSIDIGNDGSAFVEVLVSRSTGDEVYKVLLVASSFMSLSESRSGSGSNRVRMFNSDKLCQDVASEKWDRIKVICTQPFNKHATYGLHFINLHSPEETLSKSNVNNAASEKISQLTGSGSNKTASPSQPRTSFGIFKLKTEGEKTTPSVRPLTKTNLSANIEKLKRKNADAEKSVPEKKVKIENNLKDKTPPPPSASASASTSSNSISTSCSNSSLSVKKRKIKAEKSTHSEAKKFNELLSNVVFALSGYQNPQRGKVRDKALMMGAQYRRDWTQDCTHLICAFVNTPKFHQVMMGSEGKIVRADWIDDCYEKRRKLPIQIYNLRPDYSSDEGDDVVTESDHDGEEDNCYDVTTDDDESPDTEDEIEEALKTRPSNSIINKKTSPQGGDNDPYNESTDEETEDESTSIDLLPDHMSGCNFFLFGDFSDNMERMVRRHIIVCNGKIFNYMNDDVRYVITESSWCQDFDDAISDNAGLIFVTPRWVFACSRDKALVPTQPYVVVST